MILKKFSMILKIKSTYLENYELIIAINSEEAKHQKQQYLVRVFRFIGNLLAPLFIMTNISANKITFFSFLLGIISCLLIMSNYINAAIIIYIISGILDHVDGTVARFNDKASFFGRFIDGFSGIVLSTFIKLSITILVFNQIGASYIFWIGLFSAILCPMHYLYYDRYSSFARWINEEQSDIVIQPYLRNKMPLFFNGANDLQNFLLFCLPLYHSILFYNYLLILIYFLTNIFMALYTINTYTISAYKSFKIPATKHR